MSTPINTEISACCTICINRAISPRFKLTWRIRAWQQRRKWNCYRRWWTWSGLQNIYGTLLNESYFTLYAEGHFLFEMMVTDVIELKRLECFFWFSDFWRQRRTNLRARCHNSDKRLDDATWMCCTWLQPLCKCFMFDSCYRMHCEWHVFVMLSSRTWVKQGDQHWEKVKRLVWLRQMKKWRTWMLRCSRRRLQSFHFVFVACGHAKIASMMHIYQPCHDGMICLQLV